MLLSYRRLFAVVHHVARSYKCSFSELQGEGYVALKRLEEKDFYSKEKDPTGSYFWTYISFAIKHQIKKETSFRKKETSFEEIKEGFESFIPAKEEPEFSFPESMSTSAKYVCSLVLATYSDSLQIPALSEIKKLLLERGWKNTRINSVFDELKNFY